MAKSKKNSIIVIRCFHVVRPGPLNKCNGRIIQTEFHNGIRRFLCPKCRKIDFYSGCRRAIGYTHFEN